ncbi:MAG: acetyl-CoA carboxylase, carboxyl transferase, alpha subunit [Chlamydiota bacterium]|jgi:acetyl-CoA carboxylase carboxyl transferase subunit alpha
MSTLAHEKQIREYEKTLSELKHHGQFQALWSKEEESLLESKLDALKKKVYSQLSPWDRVQICRHPDRPKGLDYIQKMCDEFIELHGDRRFDDDRAVICGLAKISGIKFMVIAQEKGNDTESRVERNFGMMHPEGYRKAIRCMRMAAKFGLPILSLIDTPGAHPGLGAEERGQGWAIAENLFEMARLPTPILVVLIGEGCSGGALGIGVGDWIAMLEHSYYSVISPEGCASILWKDNNKKEDAAKILKMHPEELAEFGIIDAIIEEPLGGAHHDPAQTFSHVKAAVVKQWLYLKEVDPKVLVEWRYQKYRKMGHFSIA